MGLNIIVEQPDAPVARADHPDWDWIRYGGDRELFDIMSAVPGETKRANDNPWIDDRSWWRPTDFAAFRAAAVPTTWPERWQKLADILEADPSYWVYMSV